DPGRYGSVLRSVAEKAEAVGPVAPEPGCMGSVVRAGPGRGSVRAAKAAGGPETRGGTEPGVVGRFSQFHRYSVVSAVGLPLAESQAALASAQPADCHLHFYRRGSRAAAGCDGVRDAVSVRRPVREFYRYV